MDLPRKINPCPILDALLEIRFSSKMHPSAVFGILYNVLKDEFGKVVNLPILQLPESVRAADSNLKFKPHYRISNENFVVQIGPDVLSISSFPKYVGWNKFSKTIFNVLEKVENVGIIDSILRLGIRYVNFFESNIYNEIDLKVLIANKEIDYNNTIIRSEIKQQEFNSTLQIGNNATSKDKKGSFIDIDTFKINDLGNFFSTKVQIINEGHEKEKELFFSLLSDKFLSKLNPEY